MQGKTDNSDYLFIIILLAFFLLFSCKKVVNPPTPKYQTSICKNWEGTWWSVGGDSLFKDSLVIKFDRQEKDITFYTSNIVYLNDILYHQCPYQNMDENLILLKDNKKFIFRHD